MLKLSEKDIFSQNDFFQPCHFWGISNREIKKLNFFHVWMAIKVVCHIQIYCVYTSFQNLEIYLEPSKDRIGVSVMC